MKKEKTILMQSGYMIPCIKTVNLRVERNFLSAFFHNLESNQAFEEEDEEVEWDINY